MSSLGRFDNDIALEKGLIDIVSPTSPTFADTTGPSFRPCSACCCRDQHCVYIRPKMSMATSSPQRRALGVLMLCFVLSLGLVFMSGMQAAASSSRLDFDLAPGQHAVDAKPAGLSNALRQFWSKYASRHGMTCESHNSAEPSIQVVVKMAERSATPSLVTFGRRQEDGMSNNTSSVTSTTTTSIESSSSTTSTTVLTTIVTTTTTTDLSSSTESSSSQESTTSDSAATESTVKSSSSPVPTTLTSTLSNGDVVVVTQTSWVNVAPPAATDPSDSNDPELQSSGSRLIGSFGFPLAVCLLATFFAL